MRKNLLSKITNAHAAGSTASESRAEYAKRGASRAMMMSIDEMAENAKRLASCEVVVELDPNFVDGSFVRDRLGDDADAYVELRNAIEVQGQSSPILVRPHPEADGRYMVVFGHRRLEAAKELGRPVRAIVKELEPVAHVILQGQENSARADLTFIERALFAAKLQDAGQSKDVIKAALTIDDTLLSRMLSITDGIPLQVIEALGPQKGVGRDRWEALKKLLKKPQVRDQAVVAIGGSDFKNKPGSARFDYLLQTVRRVGTRSQRPNRQSRIWQPDETVKAAIKPSGKSFSLVLESSNAKAFGEFISSNLDELYRAFKARQTQPNAGA